MDERRQLDEAPCGFLSFSDDGILTEVNTTLLDLLGMERDAALGRHVGTLLSAGGRVFFQTHLFPLLKLRGRAEEIYLSLRTAGGAELPILLNAVRRVPDTGGEGHAAAAYTDAIIVPMHRRERFEDELLKARKAAEEAAREREAAYQALAEANGELEAANVELEAQQEELQTQQESLEELNQRLAARVERESLLNRIAFALRASSEPDDVLDLAVSLLAQALHTDRCCFAEYNLAADAARVVADWHRPDLPSLRGSYRISEFGIDLADVYGPDGLIQTDDLRNIRPGAEKPFPAKAVAALGALGMRSGIGVALYEDGVPVASLNVAMAETPRAWTEDEIELVQAISTQLRVIVEEARVRRREHRIAEYLQAALQPPIPGSVPGLAVGAYYRPALEESNVGGDFYDVFPITADGYALVVADLSGKGLQAAAQIATVRHMLRAQLYRSGRNGRKVADAISELNDMLTGHDLLSGFATLFVGAYDTRQRILTYVNAGQEPGLVRRAATGAIETLDATGPILGGFGEAEFREAQTPLAAGDALVLFTDGLTEAGRTHDSLLEIDGVIAICADAFRGSNDASPAQIAERIMAGVQSAVTPAGIRDDICLLIARTE